MDRIYILFLINIGLFLVLWIKICTVNNTRRKHTDYVKTCLEFRASDCRSNRYDLSNNIVGAFNEAEKRINITNDKLAAVITFLEDHHSLKLTTVSPNPPFELKAK